jgi:hypothetical protein
MKNMFKEFRVQDDEIFEIPEGFTVKLVVSLDRNEFSSGTKLVVWLAEAMPEYIFMGDDDEEDQEPEHDTTPTPVPDAPKGQEAVAPLTEEERIAVFAKSGGQMIIIQNLIPPIPVVQQEADSPLVKDVKQYLREQDSRRT